MSTLKLTPFHSSQFQTHNRITAGDLTLNSEEDVRAFALQLIRTPENPRPLPPTADSPSLLPPTAHSPFPTPDATSPTADSPLPTPPLSPPLPELADGTDFEELIFDFLGTDRSMQDLCVNYEITPEELETLITSPRAQATFATLRRLELLRAKLQQRNALNDAMVTLTNIANNPKARPETARKSAAAIAKFHTPKPPAKPIPEPATPNPPSPPTAPSHSTGPAPTRLRASALPSRSLAVSPETAPHDDRSLRAEGAKVGAARETSNVPLGMQEHKGTGRSPEADDRTDRGAPASLVAE